MIPVGRDVIATISHELRTPMTSLLGYTELLAAGEAGPLTDHQVELLARVERNGRRLLGLIEDLLLVSRIDTGCLGREHTEVRMRPVVLNAVEAAEAAVPRSLTEISLACDEVAVTGNQEQLERAVLNLVSNALKFTPDGGSVSVAVGVEHDTCVLRVDDTGPGIDEDDVDRIFERFYRGPGSAQLQIPGTGLGLSIVRSIAAAHGGGVSVSSAPGEGTSVTVRLPVHVPAEV